MNDGVRWQHHPLMGCMSGLPAIGRAAGAQRGRLSVQWRCDLLPRRS